jgi:hypothetical protein
MKSFVLASPVSIKCLRVLLVLALLELLTISPGCSLSAKPSKSVETLCRAVEGIVNLTWIPRILLLQVGDGTFLSATNGGHFSGSLVVHQFEI